MDTLIKALYVHIWYPKKFDILQANNFGNSCWNTLMKSKYEILIFLQDGASPHCKRTLHAYLNDNLTDGSNMVEMDSFLMKRPPWSPDLSSNYFFL